MRAAIALGSNLPSGFGAPAANLAEALRRLQALGEVLAVSTFFDTAPVGLLDQPRFINAAALLQTELGPVDLLHELLAIECVMGRVRNVDQPPKGPRVLDLDLLLYEDDHRKNLTLHQPGLVLPHPEMHRRRFVLEPLAQIAPGMQHPVIGCTIAELLERLITAF